MPRKRLTSAAHIRKQFSHWQQLSSVGAALIQSAMDEPEALKPSLLKEIVNLLSLGLHVVSTAMALQEEGRLAKLGLEIDVAALQEEILGLWSDVSMIADTQLQIARENPTAVKAQTLQQLVAIVRRSSDALSILEKIEQEKEEAERLAKTGGMSEEELAMLAEFEEMKAAGMITDEPFSIKEELCSKEEIPTDG